MASNLDPAVRRLVAERADWLCEYCLVAADDTYLSCEVDHIISLKHGGPTSVENLALACFDCNRHKGSDVGSVVMGTKAFVRFFNPRTDRWSEHFRLDEHVIVPLTDIARGTTAILQFNAAERLMRRWPLFQAGNYPSVAALARLRD